MHLAIARLIASATAAVPMPVLLVIAAAMMSATATMIVVVLSVWLGRSLSGAALIEPAFHCRRNKFHDELIEIYPLYARDSIQFAEQSLRDGDLQFVWVNFLRERFRNRLAPILHDSQFVL